MPNRVVPETLRRIAFRSAARLRPAEWLRPAGRRSFHALLFHRFFEPGEVQERALDRLRRQLEWLSREYRPVSLHDLECNPTLDRIADGGLLITTDDALIDLLAVAPVFREFEIPWAVFVCGGWTAMASRLPGQDLAARATAAVQWHETQDMRVMLGDEAFDLSAHSKAANIERLLDVIKTARTDDLESFCRRIEDLRGSRVVCTWDELRDLKAFGAQFGAHSVTHVPMSSISERRLGFELSESKRLCDVHLSTCRSFAYPFGMENTHDAITRRELLATGYDMAFLTHSDFIRPGDDPMVLPRVSMPDHALSIDEFRTRAGGSGIVLRRVKRLLAKRARTPART